MNSKINRILEGILNFTDSHLSIERRRARDRIYAELYVGENYEERAWEARKKRLKNILLAVAALLLLIAGALIRECFTEGLLEGNKLRRPVGQENSSVILSWKTEDEQSPGGSINLIVNGIPSEDASLEELFEYGERYLKKLYPDKGKISDDMDFIKSIPKTNIKVSWKPEDYTYLFPDGSYTGATIPEEGVQVSIDVELSAYGEIYELTLRPVLMPKEVKEKTFEEKLKELVAEAESTSAGAWIELPDELDGVEIEWGEKKNNSLPGMILIGLILVLGLVLVDYEKKKNAIKEREKQMLNDYPELVSKFLLLLEAGLTIHKAWEKIVKDYNSCGKKRYVYEEMFITYREMENGISEITACENFGKRCRLLPYLRFSNLCVQNLTKGAKSVLPLLEQEAINAFEERKENVKKRGEEAGTKLLFPMVGLLVIVMIMIMYPAFQNI